MRFVGVCVLLAACSAAVVGAWFTPVTRNVLQTLNVPRAKQHDQRERLSIVNGCDEDMWINFQVGAGCGAIDHADFTQLAPSQSLELPIPSKGLCGFRVWPSLRCGEAGKEVGLSGDAMDCEVGASGGLASKAYCPGDMVPYQGQNYSIGCGPPIDSKFEGTFGCTLSDQASCLTTPQGQSLYNVADAWDTSQVDGWTLPYRVRVLDDCTAHGGPPDNEIDCSALSLDVCPGDEDLSTEGQFPLLQHIGLGLSHPVTGNAVGCKAPCAFLSKGQWFSEPQPPFMNHTFAEGDAQARMYCCPQPMAPDTCRAGPVVDTAYVKTVHKYCPRVYAYSYDETAQAGALWRCPAGTRYEVTFLCPSSRASS